MKLLNRYVSYSPRIETGNVELRNTSPSQMSIRTGEPNRIGENQYGLIDSDIMLDFNLKPIDTK